MKHERVNGRGFESITLLDHWCDYCDRMVPMPEGREDDHCSDKCKEQHQKAVADEEALNNL